MTLNIFYFLKNIFCHFLFFFIFEKKLFFKNEKKKLICFFIFRGKTPKSRKKSKKKQKFRRFSMSNFFLSELRKKFRYSFDVKFRARSIGEVFRVIPTLLPTKRRLWKKKHPKKTQNTPKHIKTLQNIKKTPRNHQNPNLTS